MTNKAKFESTISIIEQLQKNPADNDLWTKLYSRYQPLVMKWARSILPNEADAEDVVQAFFSNLATKGFGKLSRETCESPRPFLKTCVTHVAIDLQRKLKSEGRQPLDDHAIASLEARRDELWQKFKIELDREELESIFAELITRKRCTKEQIAVYRARRIHDESVETISRELGTPVATIYRWLDIVEAELRKFTDAL